MKWLLNIIAKINWPFIEKKFKEENYLKIKEDLKDGDLLFTTRFGYLTNILNPSKYKHVGIFYKGRVIESTLIGVVSTNLEQFLYSKDVVKQMRLEGEIKPDLLYYIESKIGSSYDAEFEKGDDEYYCFELIAHCFYRYYSNVKFQQYNVWGGYRYLSESFNRDFKVIYESAN